MSEVELGNTTKELLRSARADGPSSDARAKIWSGVSVGTSAAAGAAASATATWKGLATAGGASKLGTLFGGVLTVGLATAVLTLGALPSLHPESAAADATSSEAVEGAPVPLTTEINFLRPSDALENLTRSAANATTETAETPKPAATRLTMSRCGASATTRGEKPARWHIAITRS